jgi:hypothetical protein
MGIISNEFRAVCLCVNTEMAFSFDRCTVGGFLNWRYGVRIENYI